MSFWTAAVGLAAEVLRVETTLSESIVTNELQLDDLEEGMDARVEWSARGGRGREDAAVGEVTRVWRPDDETKEFTVQAEDFAINVYADYRHPVVERVEGGGGGDGSEDGGDADEDPERETVGRLDRITSAE